MTTLPRPDVHVSNETTTTPGGKPIYHTHIVVSRDGKQGAWSGSSSKSPEATKEAVEKLLNDPRTIEWLP